MAEKDTLFSSKIKYSGIFSFSDFYQFCYDWLTEETGLIVIENKYAEKLSGTSKNIDVEWTGTREVTDYFKYEIKVAFKITALEKVEIKQDDVKVSTNKGSVEIKIKGTLIKDYKGKFEIDAFRKFLRSIYEKWVITSRIVHFEEKLNEDCNEFLNQAKAYLDLEGKK